MFKSHNWKKKPKPVQVQLPVYIEEEIYHGHEDDEEMDDMSEYGEDMGFDLMSSFSSINDKYLKAPIQQAIDTNREKLIQQGINQVGRVLSKTDPKNIAAAQNFTSAITSTAVETGQAALWEKAKPYLIWGSVGLVAIVGAIAYKKRKKS